MTIKINHGHAGIMTLKDGTTLNFGVIRITRNNRKLVFYTGKGLREMFKPDMTEEEKIKAEVLKKLDEKTLIRMEYISEVSLANIQSLN